MKKVLIIFITTFAMSCDAPNQSSERGSGSGLEDKAPAEPSESDESTIHSDTTTSGGMNRQNQYDTLK